MFTELFHGISLLSYWDKFTDLHGALAMLPLLFFGIAFAFYFSLDKFPQAIVWLKNTLYLLAVNLILLDIVGLYIYGSYRAPAGPKTILISSENTAWLHEILFEHKEFLAFAPWMLVLAAAIIAAALGNALTQPENKPIRHTLLFALISAFVFVAVVAGEAVLITKVAPLR